VVERNRASDVERPEVSRKNVCRMLETCQRAPLAADPVSVLAMHEASQPDLVPCNLKRSEPDVAGPAAHQLSRTPARPAVSSLRINTYFTPSEDASVLFHANRWNCEQFRQFFTRIAQMSCFVCAR
jgi:hypothetical protein